MKNKTALITGASSGLGKEFAKIHASKGGNLIVVARRKDKLLQLKKELEAQYKVKVLVITKDLTLENSVKKLYNEIKSQNIQVDYLINNTGFGGIGEFHKQDINRNLDMIKLNILALTELTALFLPDFVNRNHGKILNVSSTASWMPGPLQSIYYATKAFVTSFSYAINEEVRHTKTNVTVTTLLPGPTDTEFGKISDMDKTVLFDNTATPEKVAKDGYDAMLKGKLKCVTGVNGTLKMLMKLIPFSPKRFVLKQVYKMQQFKK
ncbi:hypothetical protein C7377_1500 [Balneicella halophila]|uniref:Oxidoreductase n=1 Tax=Balneicella halophila TaxID=1537566 RepID=A0A7L4UMU8_BALHA|nr:SDR family oxidoreductase [Balneicella halophila]PVX49862.1 hypothetical protein C7377_1500 [Balneicella halophila]